MAKYTWQQWIHGIAIYTGKKLCAMGIHAWNYVVVDGMSFRQCGRCDKFKYEGDE